MHGAESSSLIQGLDKRSLLMVLLVRPTTHQSATANAYIPVHCSANEASYQVIMVVEFQSGPMPLAVLGASQMLGNWSIPSAYYCQDSRAGALMQKRREHAGSLQQDC